MKILFQCLRHTLQQLLLPWCLSLGLAGFCLAMLVPPPGIAADHAGGLLLHLPGLLLCAAAVAAYLEAWPVLVRLAKGSDLLLRLQRGPWHGCLAAAAGCWLALILALLLAGGLFPYLLQGLGFPAGAVHAHVAFTISASHDGRQLLGHAPHDLPLAHLRLQPWTSMAAVGMAAERSPARIQVHAEGHPLHDGWLSLAKPVLELPLDPPRVLTEVHILSDRMDAHGLALLFPQGAVQGISRDSYSATFNCILAMGSYAAAMALALAVLIAAQGQLGTPICLLLGWGALLLPCLLELNPVAAAVTACARQRWLLTENLGTATSMTFFSAGVLVLLGAWTAKLRRWR